LINKTSSLQVAPGDAEGFSAHYSRQGGEVGRREHEGSHRHQAGHVRGLCCLGVDYREVG
jgi:hypothetical protein